MGFSDNLYHLRSMRNMTQEQLAMLMGVSRQAISKWESGRAYPEMDKLVRLCDIFECDLNALVRGDLRDAEARRSITLPVNANPVDICGYDRHMRTRALLLAFAPAAFMLSCALAFGISPTVLPSQGSWGVILVAQGLVAATGFGLPFLVMGLLLCLALATIAALQHLGFIGRYPYVADFYTDEQRRTTASLVRRARVVAILTGCDCGRRLHGEIGAALSSERRPCLAVRMGRGLRMVTHLCRAYAAQVERRCLQQPQRIGS